MNHCRMAEAALLVLAAVVLGLGLGAAWGHDDDHKSEPGHWIGTSRILDPASGEWCCNVIDCQPEKVKPVDGGYQTEKDFVPHNRVIWDTRTGGEWVRCRYTGAHRKGETRCLIGPPPGS